MQTLRRRRGASSVSAAPESEAAGEAECDKTQACNQDETGQGEKDGQQRHDERGDKFRCGDQGIPEPPGEQSGLEPEQDARPLGDSGNPATDQCRSLFEKRRKVGENRRAGNHPRNHRRGGCDGVQCVVQPGDVVGQHLQKRGRGEGVERLGRSDPLEAGRERQIAGLSGDTRNQKWDKHAETTRRAQSQTDSKAQERIHRHLGSASVFHDRRGEGAVDLCQTVAEPGPVATRKIQRVHMILPRRLLWHTKTPTSAIEKKPPCALAHRGAAVLRCF